MECPVCRESIISPYGLPCGHTVCACCFSQLKEANCPICRGPFHQKDRFEPNLLLEQFLSEKNSEYLALKKQRDQFVKINKFSILYTDSKHYHVLKKMLKKFIRDRDYYVPLSLLIDEFCVAYHICETELCYIIDQIRYLAALELDGVQYIINCSNWEYLTKFVGDKREALLKNPDNFYHILIMDAGDSLISLVQLCGLNPMLYTKRRLSKPDSDSYITWVMSYKDKDLPKYVGHNDYDYDDEDTDSSASENESNA